ncbi:MAG: N-acetylmuramic acid 6-phosphate etherase [Nanoarchaeota archaeon]|nr:N-acetylmuramic acid 6-phosphate etherase [Nanoarchaeota archaeon]
MKITESKNKKTEEIHTKSVEEIVDIINQEDNTVADSVKKELNNISEAVKLVVNSFNNEGRLFFIGAGTSGRLGIIQAAECPPTFGTEPEMIQGIIAGSNEAVFKAKEGSEDREKDGYDIVKEKLSPKDVLVGISASGTTPFVKGALKAGKEIGCKTISISCNKNAEISQLAENPIEVIVGAEILTGSTRMKSGTAQKMVLDMITTSALIKTGRVTGNLMTHLMPNSIKLKERAIRILTELTGLKKTDAKEILEKHDYKVDKALKELR